jgi:hypothetical protein
MEAIVAYLKVLSRHSLRETKQNYEKLQFVGKSGLNPNQAGLRTECKFTVLPLAAFSALVSPLTCVVQCLVFLLPSGIYVIARPFGCTWN